MHEPASAAPSSRSRELLDRTTSTLLVVDLQTKLLNLIAESSEICFNTKRLLRAAELLGAPMTATVQYPERLGGAPPELAEALAGAASKRAFSCCDSADFLSSLPAERDQVVLCGIETHVCMMQTAADLLAEGFRVFTVADASGSRRRMDHDYALRRIEGLGGVLVTTEMVLFEWCRTSLDPQFKEISRMVQESPPPR